MRTARAFAKMLAATAALLLMGVAGSAQAQAPVIFYVTPTVIPQTNPTTNQQPPPFSVHFNGTGFLPTTTASFSWAGGSGAGTVYYVSGSSIQVRLPSNVSPTATSVTPTLCNGASCTNATAITLTPLTPVTGTISASPNPATVGQAIVVTSVFTPTATDTPVVGAPSAFVTINGSQSGYSMMLDKTNSSMVAVGAEGASGTITLSAAPLNYSPPLVADFNDDGLKDLIYVDGQSTPQIHIVLGGAPAGYFQSETLLPLPSACIQYSSLAVGDFNKDGFSDFVVDCYDANYFTDTYVYLSNGDGTFATPVQVTGATGYAVMVGDFNKDGTPDLMLIGSLTNGPCANVCPGGFAVFTGNGDGTFTASTTTVSIAVQNEGQLLVADVDGDGYPDIIGLNNSEGTSNSVDIFRNNANASYGNAGAASYSIPLNGSPYYYRSLVTGDFHGFGLADVALVYGYDGEPAGFGLVTVQDTSTSSNISYAAPVMLPQTTDVNTVSVADFNGDGNTDLVFTAQCTTNCVGDGGLNVNFLEGNGLGSFANTYPNLTIPTGSATMVVPTTLDRNNYADLLVFGPTTGNAQPLTSYITSGSADVTFKTYSSLAGPLTITENDPGDDYFGGTSLSLTLPVSPGPVTVTVGSNLTASVYGQPVMLSSTVTAGPGVTTPPTGAVSFYANRSSGAQTLVGTAPLVGGTASLTTSTVVVGEYAITASYSGDSNFTVGQSSNGAPLTVTQATPVVSWTPTPTPIPYGTALAASQLNATSATAYFASVPGTFQYTPTLGAVLGVGTQTLKVTFTPTDTVDFSSTTGTAKITVNQATPAITWSAPAAIVVGTPLSGTQLNAAAAFGSQGTVAGTFTYAPPTGTVLAAGSNQALSVQFTPSDATDYTTANGSTTITVIPLVIGQLAPASATIGATTTPVTLTGTGFLPNSVVNINGTPVATSYISATSLSIVIPAANLLKVQTLSLTVTDPTQVQTSAATSFSVLAPPAQATFTGPTTIAPAQQPTANFTLTTAYPVPITGTVTLTFAGIGGVDDPSIQFATGGRTQTFTIPANTTTTPTIEFQSGTDAGTITVTLTLSAGGEIITPASVVPLAITVPTAAPVITSFTLTRSGDTLTANIIGYSNTRDLSQATFNFTAASGSSVSDPQVVVPATALFSAWFSNATSQQYGSSFLYTQQFNLTDNATTIGSVTVTLTNSVGASATATAQ